MDKSSEKIKHPIRNNLKYYREKLGVTQQEMEWRVGITVRHWPYYENGTREPKITLAQRFVKVFNEIALEKEINLTSITIDNLYPPD